MKFVFVLLFLSLVKSEKIVYVFAAEWPGSICRAYDCATEFLGQHDGRTWNMHGVWPNIDTGVYCKQIYECFPEEYDQFQISSYTTDLIDYVWNGLYSDTHVFRKHEWEKHGTCWFGQLVPPMSQNDFFQEVYMLSRKYDLYQALEHLDRNRPYTQEEIKTQIQAALLNSEADVHVSCVKDANGINYIGQVKFCLDEAFQPRSCKCTGSSQENSQLIGCNNEIYYPEFMY